MAGRGRRERERGLAALWIIGALLISAAVGVAVYVAIKEARIASAADEVAETRTAPPPASDPDGPRATPPEVVDVGSAAPPDAAEVPPVTEEHVWRFPDKSGTVYEPAVTGTLDVDAVRATLRETVPKLRQCEVVLGGRVGVTLEINRRGGVTSAKAEGSDEALGACAAKVLQQVRFARTTDGGTATVFVPLAFQRAPAVCDEVSCVLDNYTGECCAQYKRGANSASLPDAPGRDEIVTALRPDRRNVSTCAVSNNFEGTLKVKFTITPEGTVSRVSIDDVEPALTSCVARVIKQHTFSRSQKGVTVSFPFTVPL